MKEKKQPGNEMMTKWLSLGRLLQKFIHPTMRKRWKRVFWAVFLKNEKKRGFLRVWVSCCPPLTQSSGCPRERWAELATPTEQSGRTLKITLSQFISTTKAERSSADPPSHPFNLFTGGPMGSHSALASPGRQNNIVPSFLKNRIELMSSKPSPWNKKPHPNRKNPNPKTPRKSKSASRNLTAMTVGMCPAENSESVGVSLPLVQHHRYWPCSYSAGILLESSTLSTQ